MFDTVQNIAGLAANEVGATSDSTFNFGSWSMDFVTSMQKDVKTLIPGRDNEITYELDRYGYQTLKLPQDYYDYISVGAQVGRYVKGLSINNRVTTHKKQPEMFPLLQESTQNVWYWGGLYGYGMGYVGGGPVQAYGNGGDYGDVTIDIDKGVIVLSPTYRFRNFVLKYYTKCVEPAETTCIHPWFREPMKMFLQYKYYFYRGDSRWQVCKREYEDLYLFAVRSKYRMKVPTVVKIIERIRGYRQG